MDFGVGEDDFHRGVQLFRLEGAGGFDHFVLGDEFDFRADFGAQQHFVATGGEEAGDAPADQSDAHPVERVDGAGHADRFFQLPLRRFGADFGVDVEIRHMHPVHEVRVHVRRAERVALEPPAVRVRFLHRPEHHRNFQPLDEHRDDHAERKSHEVGDDQVGTLLLEIFQLADRLVFEVDHAVAADDFDAGEALQILFRVLPGRFERFVGPVRLGQGEVADFERFLHFLEFPALIVI